MSRWGPAVVNSNFILHYYLTYTKAILRLGSKLVNLQNAYFTCLEKYITTRCTTTQPRGVKLLAIANTW